MFGFSFSKVLFTVVVAAIVWYGWKWMNRMQARRQGELDESGRRPVRGGRRSQPKRSARRMETEDLVQCKVCASYVPVRGGGACDRAGCPFAG